MKLLKIAFHHPIFHRLVIFRTVFAILMAANSTALASEQDAARFIHQLGNQTIDTLRAPGLSHEQRRDRVRSLLIRSFDIPFIGRFVLGPYWRRATPDQRGDYIALYGEFFIATYMSRVGGYSGQTITITGVRQASARDMIVRSSISRPGGQPINTDWRVRVVDGRYRVIDIMVEGVSMAVTQRSEFSSVARRDGVDGLLTILRLRTGNIPETASLN